MTPRVGYPEDTDVARTLSRSRPVPRKVAAPHRGLQERSGMLTYLLYAVLILEILVAVLAFVHIGAGSSSHAIKRFSSYAGAELMTVLAASGAACAWYTLHRQRWAVYGLFICLALGAGWLWMAKLDASDLGAGFLTWYTVITVAGGALLAWLISFEWESYDNGSR